MSLIYLTAFAGSLIAAFLNVWITDRLGVSITCILGATSHAISYLLCGTGAPYAVFLVAYGFNGFGLSLQDAQVNNLASRLPRAGVTMSLVQASFGLGGTLAPFLSTAFAANVERAWYYYFVAMGVALAAVVVLVLALQGRTEEQLILIQAVDEAGGGVGGVGEAGGGGKAEDGVRDNSTTAAVGGDTEKPVAVEHGKRRVVNKANAASSGAKMKRILATPAVYAVMGFAFFYVSPLQLVAKLKLKLTSDRRRPCDQQLDGAFSLCSFPMLGGTVPSRSAHVRRHSSSASEEAPPMSGTRLLGSGAA